MIAVLTESVANLPEEVARDLGITVVPFLVVRGDAQLEDGIKVQAADLYREMRQGTIAVSTSFPAPGTLADAYRAAAKGSDGIVSIHVSSGISGGYAQAVESAKMAEVACPVRPIDSRTVSLAQGFVALAAARAARAGAALAEVEAAALKARDESRFVAAFDTLEYLFRGGRLKRSAYVIGSALNFKPLIGMTDGVLKPAGRLRSLSKAIAKLADMVVESSQGKRLHLGATHADNRAGAEQLISLVTKQMPVVASYVEDITPVLGVHTGPGVVAANWWAEG